MKIKTTCVRCGKPLSGPSVYCSSCDGAELKVSEPLRRPTARPRLAGRLLLLLVLVCGVAAFVLLRPSEEATEPGRVLQNEERPSAEASAPAVATEDRSPTATSSAPADDPEARAADLAQAPETPADQADSQAPAAAPAETQPATSGSWGTAPPATDAETGALAAAEAASPAAPSADDAPQEQAVAQSGNPTDTATAATGGVTAQAAPAAVPPAVLETQSLVWLYYAKEPGKDAAAKALLEEHGYTNVQARGEWPTRYAVNYLFYRDKDAAGVRELSAALGDLEFNALYHLAEATSTRLRGYFANNPELEFVLILQ